MVVCVVPIEKFRDYIFKPGATHGKDHIFRSLGYNESHSGGLAILSEQQDAERYSTQQFSYGLLDIHGQRISIQIELPGIGEHIGEKSFLISGWMIWSDNSISLNKPFSGFAR